MTGMSIFAGRALSFADACRVFTGVDYENTMLFRYCFETFEFNQSTFELRVAGEAVDAARLPLELLNVLLLSEGDVVTKDELFEALWPGRDAEEQWLLNAVSRLRSYLGPQGRQCVVTVRGLGYRVSDIRERIAVSGAPAEPSTFVAGEPVPGYPDFRFEACLRAGEATEVWSARAKDGRQRVFKFARDANGISQIRREYAIARLLSACFPDRRDLGVPLSRNFSNSPMSIEYEFIGPDLLAWSREGDAPKSLTLAQRIALAVEVAKAVEAAHSVGVLHRDIKPSNVLLRSLAEKPEPVLMDFGSARAMRPELLDQYGISRIFQLGDAASSEDGMTLLYTAPELWDGGLATIKSDVYSLGMLLYQLVRGDLNQTIDLSWRDAVADPLLAGVIQDATAFDPKDRLSSVSELIERLAQLEWERERLQREQAARDAAQRAQAQLDRVRARRPWLISAMFVLIAGLVVSVLLYRASIVERRHAERNAEIVAAVNGFWQREVIDSGNPYARAGGQDATIESVLLSARQDVREGFAGQSALAASILESLGGALVGLTQYESAVEDFDLAARKYREAADPDEVNVQRALLKKAAALAHASRLDEADAILNPYLSVDPPFADLPEDLALAGNLAHFAVLDRRERIEEMVPAIERASELALQGPAPLHERIQILLRLAEAYQRAQRFEDAEKALRVATDIVEHNPQASVALRANTRLQLGTLLLDSGRYDEAEPLLVESEAQLRNSLGNASRGVLRAKLLLSALYQWTDRIDQALRYSGDAYETALELFGAEHVQTIRTQAQFGLNLRYAGRNEEAVEVLSAARGKFSNAVGSSPYYQMTSYYLAEAQVEAEHFAEARQILAGIDVEEFERSQPGIDAALRIEVLGAMLDWQELGHAASLELLREKLPELESCECGLGRMVQAMVGSSR